MDKNNGVNPYQSIQAYFAAVAEPFGNPDVIERHITTLELPAGTSKESIIVRLFSEGRIAVGIQDPKSPPNNPKFLGNYTLSFPSDLVDAEKIEVSYDSKTCELIVEFPTAENYIAEQRFKSTLGGDEFLQRGLD